MDANARAAIEACTAGSLAGTLTFPEVVGRLATAGVERYHADLCRAETIFYLPDGSSHRTAAKTLDEPAAVPFTGADVVDAIRAVQRGAIDYREFCRRIAAAGCVGYMVSLHGRRVVYYGPTGDSHVEHFPPAP